MVLTCRQVFVPQDPDLLFAGYSNFWMFYNAEVVLVLKFPELFNQSFVCVRYIWKNCPGDFPSVVFHAVHSNSNWRMQWDGTGMPNQIAESPTVTAQCSRNMQKRSHFSFVSFVTLQQSMTCCICSLLCDLDLSTQLHPITAKGHHL